MEQRCEAPVHPLVGRVPFVVNHCASNAGEQVVAQDANHPISNCRTLFAPPVERAPRRPGLGQKVQHCFHDRGPRAFLVARGAGRSARATLDTEVADARVVPIAIQDRQTSTDLLKAET